MSNPQQVISTGVGAFVGFVLGGPVGAAKGALYGYQAGALLFPEPLPDGPRLGDAENLNVDPGSPLVILYGTDTVAGFPMYLGPRAEISTTEDAKGGPEQTTFDYYQTIAYHLVDGIISGVCRIWDNGELVYDYRPQQPGESAGDFSARIAMSDQYESETGFVVHRGTEEQLPDSTIEAEQGIGTVPAWRGDAYIVFPNWHLKPDQAQRHPQRKFEVVGRGELVLTSHPYPYYFFEQMWVFSMPVKGGTFQYAPEEVSVGGQPVSGVFTPQGILEYLNYEPEELNVFGSPVSGVFQVAALLSYDNYEPEELNVFGSPISGTIVPALVSYNNYDPEELDVSGSPVGGALT